jgi:hypothetical protein
MNKLNTVVGFNPVGWPYIHDTMIPDSKLKFYGPDKQELYERNKKYQPDSWIYLKEEISYNFNSHGLRMSKNVEDIDSNFIYFSGTSFTMGIGINEENRFSELVSKKLSLDFINCAGPTFTTKIQVLSFFNFLKYYPAPKILVIEYAPSKAYTFFKNNKAISYFSKHIPNTEYNRSYDEFLNNKFLENESSFYRNLLQVLCEKCKIKLVELSFTHEDPFVQNTNIEIINIDHFDHLDVDQRFARDLIKINSGFSAHLGIGIHQYTSNRILVKC